MSPLVLRSLRGVAAVSLALALALAAAFTAASAQAAGPTCPPALNLGNVHTGASTSGSLTCDDPSGTGLNYYVATGPDHGLASVDTGTVNYFADANYAGHDQFTVEVDDNEGGHTFVTVSVEVVDAAPVCNNVTLASVAPGQQATGSASCNDSDPGDAGNLTYRIDQQPAHGTASVSSGSFTYTPAAGFSGTDTFTYSASDGAKRSPPATVTVTVVNHAPTCHDDSATLRTGKPLNGSSPCSDEDPQNLTLSVVDAPAHGTATIGSSSGTPIWIYNPAPGFTGSDHFTIRANDGITNSAPARIDLTVTPNHAPACTQQSVHIAKDTPTRIYLFCSDSDPQDATLTYAPTSPNPAHGTLSEFSGTGSVKYTPASGYEGSDQFGFSATDGDLTTSSTQRVHIGSHPVCDSPGAIRVNPGATAVITPPCTQFPDDFSSATYVIVAPPGKGSANAGPFSVTYTANADAQGSDSFTLKLTSSGAGDSNVVTQPVTINAKPTASIAGPDHAISTEPVTLTATDADSDGTIASRVWDIDGDGFDDGSGTSITTALGGPTGDRSVRVKVTDNDGASTIATKTITVADPPPTAPTGDNPGGGGNPAGGNNPPGGGSADTAAPRLSSAVPKGQKLSKALAKGLRLTLTSDEAARATIALTLDAKTAKKLKLGRNVVVVGKLDKSLAAGANNCTVKFGARARKALRKLRKVQLSLAISATDAAGNTASAPKRLTLKR